MNADGPISDTAAESRPSVQPWIHLERRGLL